MRPILFNLGPVPIRSYGFMVFVGFVIALYFTREMSRRRLESEAKGQSPNDPTTQHLNMSTSPSSQLSTLNHQPVSPTRPITPDDISSMALIALWVGIVGARLLFVVMDWGEYSRHPEDIVKIWQGGMTAYGAILFGLLYMGFYCWRHRLSFLEFADLAAPGIAFVYAIGRIGCFLNGCCYGAPTNLPWAMSFMRDGHPELGYTPPSHPAQLYSTLMNLFIFGILYFRYLRPHRKGEVFFLYLALFCVYRTIYEQFRKGYTADIYVLGLTHAQVFNLLCLPVVLFLLLRMRSRKLDVHPKLAASGV